VAKSKDYSNPWTYMERTFDSIDVGDYFGFVYLITNLTNQRQYIGENTFGRLGLLKEKREK
jgi:hypothetical protein